MVAWGWGWGEWREALARGKRTLLDMTYVRCLDCGGGFMNVYTSQNVSYHTL